MKPILVLQHDSTDGPAHFATWAGRHGVALDVRDAQAGDALPHDLSAHRALCVLGGAMSANDDLPALRLSERLMLEAMREGKPVIGHCLGGQLLARALGATVGDSPAPEIGWQPTEVRATPAAEHWFGAPRTVHVFHWHYDAFELPPGAEWLARSDACPHQAFAIGPHLGMQFHIEQNADKLALWLQEEYARGQAARRAYPATVQSFDEIRAGAAVHMAAHQALAERVYGRWAEALPV